MFKQCRVALGHALVRLWNFNSSSPTLLRAGQLLWCAGRGLLVASVALISMSGLGVVALLLLGNALLSELMSGREASHVSGRVWLLAAVALVVAGVIAFSTAIGSALHRLLIERTIRYCVEIVLELAARISLREFDSPEFHDRLQRASQEGIRSALPIAMAVPQVAGAVVSGIGIAGGLAVVNPWLVPVSLFAGLPLWLAGRRSSQEMYAVYFGLSSDDRSRFNIEGILSDRKSAAEVRAFGLAPFLLSRWSSLYDVRIEEVRRMARRHIRRSAVGSLTGSVILGVVLAVVLVLLDRGVLDLGAAATACVAVLLLANRSQQAASSLAHIVEQRLYLNDLLYLRDWSSQVTAKPTVAAGPFATLSMDAVSFAYPSSTAPALSNVSLDINAGEVVALVGQNGSGKTTLAKLLAGLYEPTCGSIRWDGHPLHELMKDGGLAEVGVVFQDFGRYWFSAAENIGLGDVERLDDRAAIEEAAARAGVGDVLGKLPAGLDTPLAVELEGGTDLSVGQWQRVAIARVLFRRASFILLDEPTAALDAEAEAALFETIRGLTEGRTVVLISHRFSTVRTADRILVLHEGELVEAGGHAELMALGGLYAKMYRLQSQAYVEA